MRGLLWIALLLLPLIGHAGPLEKAAFNAFRIVQTQIHHEAWEYGGIIVKRPEGIYISEPTTEKKADAVMVDVARLLIPGDTLIGLYHTHPCLPDYWTGLYSFSDVVQQLYWKVPSFILDQCTMQVHEFEMGVDQVWDSGKTITSPSGQKIHLPAGRILGSL